MILSEADALAEVREVTHGRGVDVPIEAMGMQDTFEKALRTLRPGGTLSSVGCHPGVVAGGTVWRFAERRAWPFVGNACKVPSNFDRLVCLDVQFDHRRVGQSIVDQASLDCALKTFLVPRFHCRR